MASGDAESWYVGLSSEQVSLLESDVLLGVSYGGDVRSTADGTTAFQSLDVVWRSDFHRLDEDVMGAFSFGSVLSARYVIEHLEPTLAEPLAS